VFAVQIGAITITQAKKLDKNQLLNNMLVPKLSLAKKYSTPDFIFFLLDSKLLNYNKVFQLSQQIFW